MDHEEMIRNTLRDYELNIRISGRLTCSLLGCSQPFLRCMRGSSSDQIPLVSGLWLTFGQFIRFLFKSIS